MRKVNNITILYTVLVIILGIISLTLLIIGVATRKWIGISTDLTPLETQISRVLSNTTFINSLISTTGANQAQVVQIISATEEQMKQQLTYAIPGDVTYHLYGKNPNIPQTSLSFKLPQGFIFAGIASIFVGLLLTLIVIVLALPPLVRNLPLFFLGIGPVFLTIGFSFYPKTVIEDFGIGLSLTINIGFSIILVITGTIVGYNTASLFALIILQPLQNRPFIARNFNAPPRSIFRPSYPIRMRRKW